MSVASRKVQNRPTEAERQVIREAEAMVAGLAERFNQTVQSDVARARALLAGARIAGDDRSRPVRDIFDIVHNIKGQGGSFGYQLVTRIGASLCDYLRHGDRRDDASLAVIDAHLSALQFVLDRRIKGMGGALGAKLVAKLAGLTG